MGHIYEDIQFLTGVRGIMTHQLPNACDAMEPWLREQVRDVRFWDDTYDPNHLGEFEIEPMTEFEKDAMIKRFAAMPSLLEGKNVALAIVEEDS